MNTHKIAISVPADLLRTVDQWAERLQQSRSRFITEQMEKRLRELEDAEATRLYDEAYQEEGELTENRQLAEEMLRLAPAGEGEEGW